MVTCTPSPDLPARLDWELRLTGGSFGISIPVLRAGAAANVNAVFGVEVSLGYGAGGFIIIWRAGFARRPFAPIL